VGRARWDAWLRGYFDRHAFRPQTSRGFLADLRQHLIGTDVELEARLGLDEWVFGMGLPANAVRTPAEAFRAIDAAAEAFAATGALPDATAWSSAERVRFLERLPRRQAPARLAALARHLQLDTQRNSEVRFAWLSLAIANRYPPAEAQIEDFLTSQGRRKFVLPLYRDLMGQGSWGEAIARRIYARARPGYHAVTTGSVDAVMEPARAGD
jgi:leukotriene-A4 hydrolase